jgi:hypothetical protein
MLPLAPQNFRQRPASSDHAPTRFRLLCSYVVFAISGCGSASGCDTFSSVTNPMIVGQSETVSLSYDADLQRLIFDLDGAQWFNRDPLPSSVVDGTTPFTSATMTLLDDWEADLEGLAEVQLDGVQGALVFVGGPPACA